MRSLGNLFPTLLWRHLLVSNEVTTSFGAFGRVRQECLARGSKNWCLVDRNGWSRFHRERCSSIDGESLFCCRTFVFGDSGCNGVLFLIPWLRHANIRARGNCTEAGFGESQRSVCREWVLVLVSNNVPRHSLRNLRQGITVTQRRWE